MGKYPGNIKRGRGELESQGIFVWERTVVDRRVGTGKE